MRMARNGLGVSLDIVERPDMVFHLARDIEPEMEEEAVNGSVSRSHRIQEWKPSGLHQPG